MFKTVVEVTGARETIQGLSNLQKQILPKSIKSLARLMYEVQGVAPRHYYRENKTPPDMGAYMVGQPVHVGDDWVSWGLPQGETNARIAAFRDTGGTIRPKAGRALRIPLPPALTSAGVDRFPWPAFVFKEALPYGNGVTRWFARNHTLYMVTGKKKMSVITPMYSLVPQATVGPHPWFQATVDYATALIPSSIMSALDTITAKGTA